MQHDLWSVVGAQQIIAMVFNTVDRIGEGFLVQLALGLELHRQAELHGRDEDEGILDERYRMS